MSATPRRNGWRGLDGIGERVHHEFGQKGNGGWMFRCDGMPTQMGCGSQITVPRRWSTVGKKKSGWVVMYGLEPNTSTSDMADPSQCHDDHDVVLCFCPTCAAHVAAHALSSEGALGDEGGTG